MNLGSKVIVGVAWLSGFKILSQAVSWFTTIAVARILTAQDYGLMEMATIFTGYIEFFVEFGISAAIINKTELKESELNTIFWFLVLWGLLLGSSCLMIAPLTVWFFNNNDLLKITSSVGILFMISSMIILPRSILHRDLKFKEVGAIDAISIIFACLAMVILANHDAGVWTLLIGTILREMLRLIILYYVVSFRPQLHFSLNELKPILKFGAPVVAANSLTYVYNKSDRFFGGRRLGEYQLGFYAIALQLAAVPVEKILSIFQSAIFPAFSKLKDNTIELKKLFLKFSKIIYTIIMPLFVGGYFVADQLIPILLGEKWRNSILPFKYLVVAQVFVSINSPLSIIHTARGRPGFTLWANIILTPLMFIGFYYSSQLGTPALLALPWISLYPIFTFIYLLTTLKSLELPLFDYLIAIKDPLLATTIMGLSIFLFRYYQQINTISIMYLIELIVVGVITYLGYMLLFARDIIKQIRAEL